MTDLSGLKSSALTDETGFDNFIAHSSDGHWRFDLEQPLPIDTLSEDLQIEHLYDFCVVSHANDSLARIYGFDNVTKSVGRRLHDLFDRSDEAKLSCIRAFVRSSYQLTDTEAISMKWDGHERHYSTSLIGIIADGAVRQIWGTHRDISERMRLEAALSELEQRLSSVFHNAAVPIIVSGTEGEQLFVNHALGHMLGSSPEQLKSKRLQEIGSAEDNPQMTDGLYKLLDGTIMALDIERHFSRADGSKVWGKSVTHLVRDENRAPLYFVTTISDITDHKNATEMLERRSQELNQERQWLEQVIDLMPTPVVLVEQERNWIRFANKAADAMAGGKYPVNCHISENAARFVLTDASGRNFGPGDKPAERASRGEQVRDVEIGLRFGDIDHTLIVNADAIPEMYSHPAMVMLSYQDITERSQAQKDKTKLLRQVERSASEQRKLLHDVLSGVTEGRLSLCESTRFLPSALPQTMATVTVKTTAHMKDLRDATKKACIEMGFSELRWENLMTAASECAMNAIVHGGGGVAKIHSNGVDAIQVWVEDRGHGITMGDIPKATLQRGYSSAGTFGHGFWLMLQMVDSVHLLTSRDGTTVVLEQRRDAPPPAWV